MNRTDFYPKVGETYFILDGEATVKVLTDELTGRCPLGVLIRHCYHVYLDTRTTHGLLNKGSTS